MGFSYNVNVLNQKGSPALYTDTFANRPAAGYAGRLFIANDTSAIYEDTGTAWVLIANVSSGAGTLEQVTTNGNTTTKGISISAGGLSTNSLTDTALTLGSVLFAGASGLVTQDNAGFFWDDTNNRLGINTVTPSNTLDLHFAGTASTLGLNNTAGNAATIVFANTGANKWRIGNSATNTFDFYNNSLTKVLATLDGLGLFTLTSGSTNNAGLVINATSGNTSLINYQVNSVVYFIAAVDSGGNYRLNSYTGAAFNGVAIYVPTGTYRVLIGNLTTDDGVNNLQVSGGTYLNGTFQTVGIAKFNSRVNVNGATDDGSTALNVTGSGKFSSTVTSQANGSTFGTAGSTGRGLIVQSGSTNQAIQLKNAAGGDGTISATGTSTSLNYSFSTYSTADALVIQNNGNVGIGCTPNFGRLEIQGTTTNKRLYISTNTFYSNSIDILAINSSGSEIPLGIGGSQIQYFTNATERMRITYDGNILIGSTTDDTVNKLQVNGTTATTGVKFPATQVPSADPNTLDDYEEGTWTPLLIGGTSGQATSAGNTYGNYTKIGRLVTLNFVISLSSVNTLLGGVYLSQLPFNLSVNAGLENRYPQGSCTFSGLNTLWASVLNGSDGSTNKLALVGTKIPATSTTALLNTDLTNSTVLAGSIQYIST